MTNNSVLKWGFPPQIIVVIVLRTNYHLRHFSDATDKDTQRQNDYFLKLS